MIAPAARLVGLDVGTSSVKGLALDADGAVLARAGRSYAADAPRPGWSEQDPQVWWEAAQAVLAELDAPAADGIGLTGQMHGLVALGADDVPLRPAILWNDARTGPQCERIEAVVGRERLVALTGNRALAGFTAPKLLWMREHEPDAYARIAHVLLPKDYVRMRLLGGVHASDVADLSGTLLLDVAARDWSDEVLAALEVDRAWLPSVHESHAVTGVAYAAGGGRRRAGGVPVAAGAGDQAAGALGVGAVGSRDPLSLVLGTSGVVFGGDDACAIDPAGRVHAFCHAAPGTWHRMGVVLSAGGALTWLARALGDVPIETLLAEAAQVAPGAEGLLFAPYLAGERTPHADPDVRGGFVGLGLHHGRGALVRAVLEGVALALRQARDLVDPQRARPAARVAGGGARSALWLEILAAALDTPLEVPAATEGAAYGAALLGGVAGGVFGDARDAARATVRVAGTVEPRREWVAAYDALAARYAAVYPALAALRGP